MKNQFVKRMIQGLTVMAALAALTQVAGARVPVQVVTPDTASTSALMGVAFAGLAMIRKFTR